MLIDTHCHLLKEYYSSISDELRHISDAGIKKIVISAYDEKTITEVLNISKMYENVYCSIGIHPSEADKDCNNALKLITNNINNPKVVAIGEIGLDYHYEDYNKEAQINLLSKQLEIAERYNKPVVIHSREATEDTINVLKKYSVKGVIHSFSGSVETANMYIKMGFYLGINGVITFKNCHLIEVIRKIGVNNIVLETDSPYLTPTPYRGTKNSPSNIVLITKYLSDELGIDVSTLANITGNNACHIFDI